MQMKQKDVSISRSKREQGQSICRAERWVKKKKSLEIQEARIISSTIQLKRDWRVELRVTKIQPTRIMATAIPATGQLFPSHRSHILHHQLSVYAREGGGWSEPPRSPLEAPTVRQGAQRTLVKAFQESGSGEGGGEAEGGLPLWNAACSGHVTGRAQRETPTNKIKRK